MRNFYIYSLIFLLTAACGSADKDPASRLLKANSHEITALDANSGNEDLAVLSEIVGNASIAALGESRHDLREQFQLKHRMVRYLVEEMGFTKFILEASLPYAHLVNDYIKGGEGDLGEIMNDMPGWFLWDTQEFTEMLEWMREYNQSAESETQLSFHGIDIIAPAYGMEQVFAYLENVDEDAAAEFSALNFGLDLIDDNFWQNTAQYYHSLSSSGKLELRNNYARLFDHINDNEQEYIASSSAEAYEYHLLLARNASLGNSMFSTDDRLNAGLLRDNAMAYNVEWIIKNTGNKKEKAVIWSHNVHILKSTFRMTGFEEDITGMGALLHQKYKNKYVAVGASFNQGDFGDWNRTFDPAADTLLDGRLAALGKDMLIVGLDTESENGETLGWLDETTAMQGQDFIMTCVPTEAFDALYFVNEVSRAIPNPGSAQRLRNME